MDGCIKNHLVVGVFALLFAVATPQSAMANPLWTDQPVNASQARESGASVNRFLSVRRVKANRVLLSSVLSQAPMEKTQSPASQIQLPLPDGSLMDFYIVESPVMAHGLARKYPEIKTYKVRSVSDDFITGRVDIGPQGFHAYMNTPEGVVYIDPESATDDLYNSFYKRDYLSGSRANFSCGVSAEQSDTSAVSEFAPMALSLRQAMARTSNELLTYRIAIATTGEYSQTVAAGDAINTLAAVVTAISRVNQIYERDLAIHLELVSNNDQVIFTNAATDPYTNNSDVDLLEENQATLDSVLGSAAYDIGHVFSTGGGGLASLGVVCNDSFKAQGETGSATPFGDPFYIDFVAHEIGHQFAADHSFNGTSGSCGFGNRNAATAYEPGSGTTIMAYADICTGENIQSFSDDTFHAGSIEQIVDFTRVGGGAACSSSSATGNSAPVVDAGMDYTIPAVTPFALSGSATDVDAGDTLIYQWDEMDVGTATTSTTIGMDLITNALFRSFSPTTSTDRVFPQLSTLLSGLADIGETLPTQDRVLKFRLSVRDLDAMLVGKGGVDSDDVVLTVDGFSGPFAVLQPNTTLTLDVSQLQHEIEWNSACTELAPVNCSNVDIWLSTDGGNSFPTLLSGNTPNDGTEAVDFPLVTSSTARLKIACTGNIFFDISDVDFALANGVGQKLLATGAGGSSNCNVPGIVPMGPGNDVEPNDFSAQAQTISVPFNIVGGINDSTDYNDFFSFTAIGGKYTFTLSNYGSNDLDLYLMDATGALILRESSSAGNPTENISLELGDGRSYYIVVNGYDTSGNDVLYTLDIGRQDITSTNSGGVLNYWFLCVLTSWYLLRVTSRPRRKIIH